MGFEQVQRFIREKNILGFKGHFKVVRCCQGLFHSEVSLTAFVNSKHFTPLYFKLFPLSKMLLFYT